MHVTRKSIQELLSVSNPTVRSWCKGFYLRKGKPVYYFPSTHKLLSPVAGRGKIDDPYLYDFDAVRRYQNEIKLK